MRVYDVFSEVWVSMCDVYALETLDKSHTSFCNWGQQMSKNMHGQMKWSMDNRQDDACEIFWRKWSENPFSLAGSICNIKPITIIYHCHLTMGKNSSGSTISFDEIQ
jgi:hypothetical protein